MSTEENKAIVRAHFQTIFTEKKLDLADETVAQDYVHHGGFAEPAPGLAAERQRLAMIIAAVPDLYATIEDMVAEGDNVGVRWTGGGTLQGELAGIPPTGKPWRIEGISIYRISAGKIAEQWESSDALGALRQFGVIPAS